MAKISNSNPKTKPRDSIENAQSLSIIDIAEKLKNLGSPFATIVGIAYALGFLISNVYLNTRYNIYDFTLVKTRYIYSGFFFLLLLFMAYLGAFVTYQVFEQQLHSTRLRRWGTAIFTWFTASSIWSLSLKSILSIVQGYRANAYFEFPITGWFRLAILFIILEMWVYKRRRDGIAVFPFPVTTSILTGIVILASIFSIQYYGLVPFSLGGGMPIPVQLVIEEDKVGLVEQIVPIESNNITDTVLLLDKSPNSYFLLVSDTISKVHSIEMNNSLVIGVVHPQEIQKPFITSGLIETTTQPTQTATTTPLPTP